MAMLDNPETRIILDGDRTEAARFVRFGLKCLAGLKERMELRERMGYEPLFQNQDTISLPGGGNVFVQAVGSLFKVKVFMPVIEVLAEEGDGQYILVFAVGPIDTGYVPANECECILWDTKYNKATTLKATDSDTVFKGQISWEDIKATVLAKTLPRAGPVGSPIWSSLFRFPYYNMGYQTSALTCTPVLVDDSYWTWCPGGVYGWTHSIITDSCSDSLSSSGYGLNFTGSYSYLNETDIEKIHGETPANSFNTDMSVSDISDITMFYGSADRYTRSYRLAYLSPHPKNGDNEFIRAAWDFNRNENIDGTESYVSGHPEYCPPWHVYLPHYEKTVGYTANMDLTTNMGNRSIKELDYEKYTVTEKSSYGDSGVTTESDRNLYLWWSAISNSDLSVPAHHLETIHLSPINMFGWYDKILYQIYIYAENVAESTNDYVGGTTTNYTTSWQVDAGCGEYTDNYIVNAPNTQPRNRKFSSAISDLLKSYWGSTGKLNVKYGPSGHKYFAYLIDREA